MLDRSTEQEFFKVRYVRTVYPQDLTVRRLHAVQSASRQTNELQQACLRKEFCFVPTACMRNVLSGVVLRMQCGR